MVFHGALQLTDVIDELQFTCKGVWKSVLHQRRLTVVMALACNYVWVTSSMKEGRFPRMDLVSKGIKTSF